MTPKTNGSQPSVAIVGAGPAGLSAAWRLGRHGAHVTLIDQRTELGGAAHRLLHSSDGSVATSDLTTRLRGLPVRSMLRTLAWGFFSPDQLALLSGDRADVIQPSAILLATGAIERTLAFPGWTLPGVITAGGAQKLVLDEGVLPGERILMAGTGPLLMSTAIRLAKAGATIAGVVDCAGIGKPVRGLGPAVRALRQPGQIRQWIELRRALRDLDIPYLSSSTVLRATGRDHVEEVVTITKQAEWELVAGTERSFPVDTLCLNYGLTASLELAQVIGCRCGYADSLGGWHVSTDGAMRTSQSGVFAAGQITGIGGLDLVEATGELAGLSIASDLGILPRSEYEERARPVRNRIKRSRGLATTVNTAFAPGRGAGKIVTPDTMLCRCEEVEAGQVDAAVAAGARTLDEIKRHTRCGMGFCQGRICEQTIVPYLQSAHGIDPRNAGKFTARAPIRPISLSALATLPDNLADELEDH